MAEDLSYRSIPANPFERDDMLKEGASSIYGPNTIADVVNSSLRKDFEGFEI
jgi:hypothetical protein